MRHRDTRVFENIYKNTKTTSLKELRAMYGLLWRRGRRRRVENENYKNVVSADGDREKQSESR